MIFYVLARTPARSRGVAGRRAFPGAFPRLKDKSVEKRDTPRIEFHSPARFDL
jgi:hypothetical protein